jgi:hypothetical protein
MVYDEDVVPATAAACKETEQKEEKKQEGHKKASRAIRELKGNNNKNATQLQADLSCMGRKYRRVRRYRRVRGRMCVVYEYKRGKKPLSVCRVETLVLCVTYVTRAIPTIFEYAWSNFHNLRIMF